MEKLSVTEAKNVRAKLRRGSRSSYRVAVSFICSVTQAHLVLSDPSNLAIFKKTDGGRKGYPSG
jgi:hypothetical protein